MSIRTLTVPLLLLIGVAVVPGAAEAGPPLLCHAHDLEGHRSLPWTHARGWRGTLESYDRGRLARDVGKLLAREQPMTARLETLRRAALYAVEDEAAARELLVRMLSRALDAEMRGGSDGLEALEAGYLVQSLRQAEWLMERNGTEGVLDDLRGVEALSWLERGVDGAPGDAGRHLAAALATQHPLQPGHARHVRAARRLAEPGTPVARIAAQLGEVF